MSQLEERKKANIKEISMEKMEVRLWSLEWG
jgi:hypothetical protein